MIILINKQNLWFLTLFSLILVLSVYYITMPENLLQRINQNEETQSVANIREEEVLASLRVADEEEVLRIMDELQQILLDDKKSAEEKSVAYDSLRELNLNKGKEQAVEQKILEVHELKAFVKIKNDQVKVVIAAKTHDPALANKIMRTTQESFGDQMFITVQFQA